MIKFYFLTISKISTMKTRLLLTAWLVPFFIYTATAQNWETETLRTNIVGAWIRTGDVDLDGDPDVVIQAGDSIYWHENLRPSWAAHLIDPTFYNSAYAWVDVRDFDSDGDLDVLKAPLSGTPNNPLTWNENLTNGSSWVQHAILDSPNYYGWMQGSYGDMDGDNDLDIVVPEYNAGMGSLYWLENMGNSGEYTKHTLKTGDHNYSTVADLDNDGDLDIVSASNEVFWMENHLPDTVWTQHEVAAPGSSYHLIGVCSDLNGDGAMDIISNSLDGGNAKDSYYANPGWQETGIIGAQDVLLGEVGDIDNDGDVDITYGGGGFSGFAQSLGWAENQNNGADWVHHNITPAKTSQLFCSGLADIDGDGDLDMVSLDFNTSTGSGDVFWAANPLFASKTSETTRTNFELSISPNPASDVVVMQVESTPGALFQVEMFSLDGRLAKTLEISGGAAVSVSVVDLKSGAYVVKVFNEKGMDIKKLLKL